MFKLQVLVKKSMYPDNTKSTTFSVDDKEMFRCYRQDVADTLMYCYNVLNLEMLDILNTKLNEALQACLVDNNKWPYVESCLHSFSSISECIEMENLYLPKLMCTLKEIPYNNLHTNVLSSALDCVGAYSEWVHDHPHLLEKLIPLVISGIGNADVTPNATMALKDLCYSCQNLLAPYADVLIHAAQVKYDLLALCILILSTKKFEVEQSEFVKN